MNILYIHRTQGQGVEGVHIWGIIDGFRRLGHLVRVVSPVGERREAHEDNVQSSQSSVLSAWLRMLSRYLPELVFEFAEIAYNIVAGRQIKRLAAQFKPDLIYERYAIFAISGMRYAKKHAVPIVLEVNYTSCSPLVRKRSRLLKPLAKWVDKKIFSSASTLVVVSSYLRDHLINDFSIPPDKILVCTNAADPDVFNAHIQPIEDVNGIKLNDKRVIGFVGTFSPWHGVSMLVDAFIKIAPNVDNAVVLLIGDGPEKAAIQEKVAACGLKQRVFFVGTIKHNELPRYVAAFSVGVMPDSNEYGSPMKIFEYMAMGKPIVVPDYGPLLDSIEHGKQGMIFKRKNVDSMADALFSLLKNNDMFAQMSSNAREHIVTCHNWLKNAENSLNTLEQSNVFNNK